MPRLQANGEVGVLMLLGNGFDPDPRVYREARALVKNGFQVTVLGWDRDGRHASRECVDGIQVERVHVHSLHGRGLGQVPYLLLFWIGALRRGLQRSFEIIHAHDFDTLPIGYALARMQQARLIYDSHESYVDMMHTLPAVVRRMIRRIETTLLKKADLVVTVGDLLCQHLKNRGARRTCVVGNWQDPARFVFDPQLLQAERTRLGVTPGQKVLTFIANLGQERRIPELLQAVSETPNVHLVIGGDGPCAQVVRDAERQHPNITYLGYVPPSRVPLYTALADAIFYGFDPHNPNARFSAPNKLFEALAAGKAVVTGDFGEIGRIVRAYQCGVVIPDYTFDCITRAFRELTDETLNQCGANARRASRERYNWERAEQSLLSHYELLSMEDQQTSWRASQTSSSRTGTRMSKNDE